MKGNTTRSDFSGVPTYQNAASCDPPPNTRLTALLYFRTPAVPLPLFCPPPPFFSLKATV